MYRRFRTWAAGALGLLLLAAAATPAQGTSTVTINGPAYVLDTQDGGPATDFTEPLGSSFAAANPTVAVYDQLNASNQAYAASNQGISNYIASTTPVSMIDPMTGNTVAVHDHAESNLQLNPVTGTLVGASKFFSNPDYYYFKLGSYVSADGGQTWTSQIIPGYDNYTDTTDPTLAFDDQGNVYSLNLPFDLNYTPGGSVIWKGGPSNSLITVNKSSDGGRTWGAPVLVKSYNSSGLGFTPDKQWLVADRGAHSPGKGNLYAFWTEYDGYSAHLVFSRSTDHGATWSAAAQITPASNQPFAQYAQPGVAPDGTVYVVYGVYPYAKNVASASLWLQASADGGLTWTAPRHVADLAVAPYHLANTTFRDGGIETVAVSPTTGTIGVAWEDYSNGDVDILFARSTDAGLTWSTPVRVNDDPVSDGTDQFQPILAVAPNGTFGLAFYDRRLPCPTGDASISAALQGKYNTCVNTSISFSTNDGQSWSANRRISQHSFDPSLNAARPEHSSSTTFIGDYFGFALGNSTAYVLNVSTYNLNGQNPNNYQNQVSIAVPVPTH